LKAKVDSVLNRSKYNKVDLKSIFSFMVKNWLTCVSYGNSNC
jgi:hypothetical protein